MNFNEIYIKTYFKIVVKEYPIITPYFLMIQTTILIT